MNVSRAAVAQITRGLDPVDVDARRGRALRRRLYYSKSPNRVWNLDGNEKFKPFGFEIQGFIGGSSRCVLWMNILRSNKDPKEVCNVFVNYLTKGVRPKVAPIVAQRTSL